MTFEKIIQHYASQDIRNLKGRTLGLIGDLGAGKTHFVKELLTSFDERFKNQVSSPTYNLCHIYQVSQLEVHHFDLYRIGSEEDLYDVGVLDSLESDEILVVIEWVDLFPVLVNQCDNILKIRINRDNLREYVFNS